MYPDDTHYFGFFSRWIESFNAMDDFFDRRSIRRESAAQVPDGGEHETPS